MQGHLPADLGLHEEEVPRINEDQEAAASSTSIWVRNASNEVGRVNFWLLLKNNGNHQQMRIHGEKMEDMTVIEKILRSMTPKFNYVVCFIKESKDLDELSIDELQGSLLVHE